MSVIHLLFLSIASPALADFNWGSIGDSWGSGVAYSDSNVFDGVGDCMRTTEAYSAQLLKDNGWSDEKQNGLFRACSGARLVDMARGQEQLKMMSNEPSVVIMTTGGNDASFYDIAVNCIYHFDGHTDPKDFDCDRALNNAHDYVNGPDWPIFGRSFYHDLAVTYDELFKQAPANALPGKGQDFYLYHTGYAHPFNIDASGDWCNDVTFAVNPLDGTAPKLTRDIRTRVNQLTTDINDKIARATREFRPPNPKQHLTFIDISPGFGGHRFCEGAHAPQGGSLFCSGKNGQYWRDDVWLWNVSPYFIPPHTVCGLVSGASTPPANYTPDGPLFNWDQNAPVNKQSIGPLGSQRRPFHPKFEGHTSIKDAILAQMKKDGVKGVKGAASPPASAPPPPPAPAPTKTEPAGPKTSDICGAWYKFADDHFEIYGKDFDDKKLGPSGSGLLSNLRHCGVVSDWKFDYLTNDPQGMQWKSTGNLPIGTKSCVGTALKSSGGTSADGCVGAG